MEDFLYYEEQHTFFQLLKLSPSMSSTSLKQIFMVEL